MKKGNTMTRVKTADTYTNTVSVDINPSVKDIEAVQGLLNAVDLLIDKNCFIDNNPMRKNSREPLFWDWAIVSVGGIRIPAPIHTYDDDQSLLYTYSGNSIILSNQECAYTTCIFYLDYLKRLTKDWDKLRMVLPPIYVSILSEGIKNVKEIPVDEIMTTLRSQLTDKGHQVLN
jgi:hypothetical protein